MEKLLGGPRDGALLRYSLGNEYLKAGDPAKACEISPGGRKHGQTIRRVKLLGKRLPKERKLRRHLKPMSKASELPWQRATNRRKKR